MAPRYSLVPGDFVDDARPTLAHYRVLLALGRRTNKAGWCMVSQTKLAEHLGISRQTINSAITDLVKWGYVERRGQALTKRAICQYRVLLDRAMSEAEPDDGVTPEADPNGDPSHADDAELGLLGGDVSPTADTPPAVDKGGDVSPTADTTCRLQLTHVSPLDPTRGVASRGDTITIPGRTTPSHNERTAVAVRAGGRGSPSAEDLDAEDACQRVARLLLVPLARQRQFEAPDRVFAMGRLSQSAELQALDDEGLGRVLTALLAERQFSVKPADVERHVRLEAPRVEARATARRMAALAGSGEARSAWARIVPALKARLGADVVEAWFRAVVPVDFDDRRLTLAAPSRFVAARIEINHADAVLDAARLAGLDLRELAVRVIEPGSYPTRSGAVAGQTDEGTSDAA